MDLGTDKKKIVATLSYGKVPPAFLVVIFITMLLCSIILVPITIIIAVGENQYDFLFLLTFSIVGIPLSTYFLFDYCRAKQMIKLWKQDAVLLKAKSKIIAEQWVSSHVMIQDKVVKLSVTFKYEGKKMKIVSGEQGKKDLFHPIVGFDKLFEQYDDREIDILYSPRFDQVMILK